MPFSRENYYNNRYKPTKRYFEWRNIAGEVPQAAELNEIQSLLKDLVQRTGDSILQNGDVVEGMTVKPSGNGLDTVLNEAVNNFTSNSGKVWIDGVVHDVPGNYKDLAVPSSGWGFIGVYLRKEIITSVGDPELLDPAITDAVGNPQGLSGANRLKLTPLWVAGSLPTSSFDDKSIAKLTGITNSTNSAAKLTFSLDTTQVLTGDSIYNARVGIPSSYLNDNTLTQLRIYNPEAMPLTAGLTVNCKVKLINALSTVSTACKGYIQIFKAGQPQLTVSSNNKTSISTTNVTALTYTITNSDITAFGNDLTNLQIGIVLETVNGYFLQDPAIAKIYLTDLSVNDSSIRRPKYKKFTTQNGSSYQNFMVGTAGKIKHGTYDGSDNQGVTGISAQTLLNNSVVVPISTLVDPIIRETEITDEQAELFFNTHKINIEDGKLRIYPIHITYNGVIVSSLANREYSRLNNNILSYQLNATTPNAIVNGFDITTVTGQNNKVQISSGQAFVAGRLFTWSDNYQLTLPSLNNNSDYTVTRAQPEILNFDTAGTSSTPAANGYKVLVGNFKSLTNAQITAVFSETVTHIQSSLDNPFAEDNLPLETLDKLTESAVNILDIKDSSGVIYERGLDWDLISRLTIENNIPKIVSIIGWYNQPEITGNSPRRASRSPANNAAYTVYYSSRRTLVTPANNQTSSTNLEYLGLDGSSSTYQSFTVKSSDADTTGDFAGIVKLAGFTESNTLKGPYLVSVNKSFGSGQNVSQFRSQIEIYSYTAQPAQAYLVYFDGNVDQYGPDGGFGYEVITGAGTPTIDDNRKVIQRHQTLGRLPLATVKLNSGTLPTITKYDIKSIDLAQQKLINDRVDELISILPALLSQNLIGVDGTTRTYQDSIGIAPEPKVLSTVTWKIDSDIFQTFNGYTVKIKYSYIGDSLETSFSDNTFSTNAITTIKNELSTAGTYADTSKVSGLLRGIIVQIVDSTDTVKKGMIFTMKYDPDTLNITTTQSNKLSL